MKVFLDACVVIYSVESASKQGSHVAKLIASHLKTADFYLTELVRLECRVLPLRANDTVLLAEYQNFFAKTTITGLSTQIFEHATELRAKHGLKTADALHLAAALALGCDEFWTNDGRFAKAAANIKVRRVS